MHVLVQVHGQNHKTQQKQEYPWTHYILVGGTLLAYPESTKYVSPEVGPQARGKPDALTLWLKRISSNQRNDMPKTRWKWQTPSSAVSIICRLMHYDQRLIYAVIDGVKQPIDRSDPKVGCGNWRLWCQNYGDSSRIGTPLHVVNTDISFDTGTNPVEFEREARRSVERGVQIVH